jgi:tRNA A-37 threonylcarbamoyl transferase component Bud32
MKEDNAESPFASGMYRGIVRKNLVSPELLEFLRDPDRAFSDPASTIIKDSNTTSSCTVDREQKSLHIKRYNYQSTFYALKNLFRTSRAKRVWKVAQNLIECNIPTPQPISFLEQRKGRLLIKSFFISKKIDGALPLNSAIQELKTGRSSQGTTQKKMLIQQVAHLVRALHECGICHRDLKASNILLQKKPGQEQKLYLVDLDSARVQTRILTKERIRDLARLNASLFYATGISTADRFRFLRDYLRTRNPRDEKLHLYWNAIAGQTYKKLKPHSMEHNSLSVTSQSLRKKC